MAKNNLNYKTKNFKDFILGYNTSLNIPYYQRRFIWSEPQNKYVLIKLYRDIFDQFQEDKEMDYFIGTFATCKTAINDIVDGQQRLTSLAIFIKILSKYTGTNVKQYFYDANNNFLISNECELKADLEYFLFSKGLTRNPNCSVKLAIDIAEDEVKKIVKKLSQQDLLEFEKYLLNSVKLSYIEFIDSKNALKYFLNINSLSIKLTEPEIFYAYMSQLIQATRSNTINIENIRNNVQTLDEKFKKALNEEDIIFIFLKAYFKNDKFISYLGDGRKDTLGIGRWLTGYKMDLLSQLEVAVDFTNKFVDYISDLNSMATYLVDGNCSKYKHIYLNYLLNKYTGYKHTKAILECMFKNRHPYNKVFKENLYNNQQLDMTKLDSFFKLVNATFVKNFIEGNTLTEKLDSNTEIKQISASAILKGLNIKNIFTFNYPTDLESKIKLKNDKEAIHFILAIQEAYLNHIAIPSLDINGVLYELLDTNKFTIEHLYSKKDFRESNKLQDWQAKGTFKSDYDFDSVRSSFRNLSIISRNENSSLGANVISKKIGNYKTARAIGQTNEPEYLIQSLADGSDFYNNKGILTAALPERKISLDTNANTWSHSVNNDIFIERLTELAVKELFS